MKPFTPHAHNPAREIETVPYRPAAPSAPAGASAAAGSAAAKVVPLATRAAPGAPRLRPEDPATTHLFTDVEGSTRLWELDGERMRAAMAAHDAACREAVRAGGGQVVKATGDGIHAVFADPLGAVQAALRLQLLMAPQPAGSSDASGTSGIRAVVGAAAPLTLHVRAGMHCGASEARDGDFFGPALNRAARVMGAAHGAQVLLTQEVAERVAKRLPEAVRLVDLGAVRLRDLAGAQRVWQLVHPQLRQQFPPLRSLEATPNNLAQQLNSFVGRERELAEVRELLGKTRLLTLLGMGGIGKSRLSVQLGAELLDEYPDGVWLVELAPLADPRGVPQALASVLGVREEAGLNVLDALLGYVCDKRLLVILDNCEHVLHACADLAKRVLQAGAGVKVLTTSRDVLQVAGETVYQVPTLTVPPMAEGSDDEADVATLSHHEAVRLFMDRAAAVQPTFGLTRDTARPVAEICRRLDGIPLALELAAARTRALSVQAVAARLKDRFRLLVTGDQTVLPRQRTLRALIDWSYELLADAERVMFRRLSVFAGGWTLEAAEAVCAGPGLDTLDVLDLLAQLVQKSLVVMEPGGARYRMLQTVRAYAATKLAATEGEASFRRRHVVHCVRLADQARSKLVSREQPEGLALLDVERENLLAAHAWCGSDPACIEEGLQLVFLLKIYWHARGLLSLGHRVTVDALARLPAQERSFRRCRALCDAGQLAYHMGRYDEARSYLEDSHAIAQELGDQARLSAVLPTLAAVLGAVGERARAIGVSEAAVRVAAALGQHRQQAVALTALAQLQRAAGSLQQAEAACQQALRLFGSLEDREGEAISRLNLAMFAIAGGRLGDALAQLRQVDETASILASRPVSQSLLDVAAGLCGSQRKHEACARLFGAAEAHAMRTGIRRDPEDDAFLRPIMARSAQALGQPEFDAQIAIGRSASPQGVSGLLHSALHDGA